MQRLSVPIGSIFMLIVCACAPPKSPLEIEADNKLAAHNALAAPYIGHSYWPRRPGGLCLASSPGPSPERKCGKGRLLVDGLENTKPFGVPAVTWLHLTFESGPVGYISLEDDESPSETLVDHDPRYDPEAYPLFLNTLGEKEAEARRKLPGVLVGSQMDDVPSSAWGEPVRKKERSYWSDRSRHASRESQEIWFYSGGGIIAFLNRSVVAIKR